MRGLLIVLALLYLAPVPARAQELTTPALPSQAQAMMPEQTDSFGEGMGSMAEKALPAFLGELRQGLKLGLSVFCCVLLVSILQTAGCRNSVAQTAGAVSVTTLLLGCSRALMGLAVDTVTELSEYSKLFLPVLAAASSARGAFTSSAALCLGTTAFTAFLSNVLRRVLLPSVYLFLAASVASCALGEDKLKQLQEQLKKLCAWFLKTVLTVFLAYMSVTGAVTGAADKTAVKTAKAAISAVVPVIGKNLADASEALLLGGEVVKNSLGLYGIFAFFSIFLYPFLRIGAHYLILKGIAALCGIIGSKGLCRLTEDFSAALGLLLAATGVLCALNIIGTVCFLKGAL